MSLEDFKSLTLRVTEDLIFFFFFDTAVIFTVPAFFPVTTPFLFTVATLGLLDLKDTFFGISFFGIFLIDMLIFPLISTTFASALTAN